ncbi:hypothetical protein FB45DRAFT_1032809 [Roridomyces roridus]|uniref:Uncharacterized protein n=1 Tax=Roridomyces roridus TaxID=1738132 RepID=A0AAD7BG98_9AGAR|nr:hypothetical protein FB45DRAFT_1032809 [Roridomyces roridus]
MPAVRTSCSRPRHHPYTHRATAPDDFDPEFLLHLHTLREMIFPRHAIAQLAIHSGWMNKQKKSLMELARREGRG